MTRLLGIIALLCFVWQCQDDEANDPLTPSSTPTPNNYEGKECPGIALDAFEAHIQPAIDASCSTAGCHADDVHGNATASEASHTGGNQIAKGHITEQGITAWVKAEQKCSSGD